MNVWREILGIVPPAIKATLRQKLSIFAGLPYPRFGIPVAVASSVSGVRGISAVDVGAHEGLFTSGLERLCGIRKALLCEPIPDRADSLRQTFLPPKYEIFQGAVAAKNGDVELYLGTFDAISSILPILEGDPNLATIDATCRSTITVKSRTLDSLLIATNFGRIDLLKIDVQGAELLVLEGASNTLVETDRIWIETSLKPLYKGSALFPDVYGFLTSRGFGLRAIEPTFASVSGEILQVDVLFAR